MSKESWIQYSLLCARWIWSEKAVLEIHNKNSVAQKLWTILTEHNLQKYTKLYDLQKQHNFKCIYSHIYLLQNQEWCQETWMLMGSWFLITKYWNCLYVQSKIFMNVYHRNLSWQAYICALCHSLSKIYYIIKSLKNILSNRMLWNIYCTYFQSWLRYVIILWGGTREI